MENGSCILAQKVREAVQQINGGTLRVSLDTTRAGWGEAGRQITISQPA